MSEWSHLPNAQQIDWVLKSVRTHRQKWTDAYDATGDAALDRAWDAALHVVMDVGRSAAWVAAWDAVSDAARAAILALVAYDHAGKYFDMPSDQVRVWATLSEEPAAILMFPAVVARERIEQVEPV